MASKRIGGIISLKIDGRQYFAKGNFTYNLGTEKREAVIGADGVHGYKAMPQVAFIEGEITDDVSIDMKGLTETDGATLTLDLANGKSIVLREAWFAGEGTGNTEEGNFAVRFEAKDAEEIL